MASPSGEEDFSRLDSVDEEVEIKEETGVADSKVETFAATQIPSQVACDPGASTVGAEASPVKNEAESVSNDCEATGFLAEASGSGLNVPIESMKLEDSVPSRSCNCKFFALLSDLPAYLQALSSVHDFDSKVSCSLDW